MVLISVSGIDFDLQQPPSVDVVKIKIFDLFATKHWTIKYATERASTILKLDQIIMAKRPNGPKPKEDRAQSDDES